MRIRSIMLAAALMAGILMPTVASAATKATVTEGTYGLDFTLPTAGKSGCMVCHGDPNLAKITGETTSTIFVDVQQLETSAHKADLCTGCHIDFAYTAPHDNTKSGSDWSSTAKLACKNCKSHQPQFAEYAAGAHSPAGTPGQSTSQTVAARAAQGKPIAVPLCGDCHSSHSIPAKEDTAAVVAYRAKGIEICGTCHQDFAESYTDYYHGAAYRAGAADAPTCWDCHGTHEVLPADNRRSMVNERNLVITCGQEGCHSNVDEEFVHYAGFIHGRGEILASNPVWMLYDSARSAVAEVFAAVSSWFSKG